MTKIADSVVKWAIPPLPLFFPRYFMGHRMGHKWPFFGPWVGPCIGVAKIPKIQIPPMIFFTARQVYDINRYYNIKNEKNMAHVWPIFWAFMAHCMAHPILLCYTSVSHRKTIWPMYGPWMALPYPIIIWPIGLPLLTPVTHTKVLHITLSGYIIEVLTRNQLNGGRDMNYKALRLKVDNHLYYRVVSYAERERRSINNSVEYILQRYFEEHPLDEEDDYDVAQDDGYQEER